LEHSTAPAHCDTEQDFSSPSNCLTEDIAATVPPQSRPVAASTPSGGTHADTISHPPHPRAWQKLHDTDRTDPLETQTLASSTSTHSVATSSGLVPPNYDILGELGRGGMGVVFKARDRKLNRDVALKMMLSAGYAHADDLARFKAEAEAIARLEHPYIVRIYEIGEHNGRPYIALEYCDGGSLNKKIAGEPQPSRVAAELVAKLARGMAAAHARGVVHRDLKPGNVLLTPDGEPKITDFGLAKRIDDESGQTHTGAILGTPSYMAPEQASGESKRVGPPADIYALGAILYDMLTGRPPFKGESAMDTAIQVVHAEVVPPTKLIPKLPRDLEVIALKCLEKDPAKRYASASELADDLQRFLEGRPILARPAGTAERVWKWAKRRPAVAALLAAVVLLTVGGLITVTTLWQRAEVEKIAAQRARDDADNQRVIAEQNEAEAQRQRQVAERNEAEAQRQRVEALKQKERADRFFSEAREVIEALTHVGQVDLADTPGAEGVRRKVLMQALDFFDELDDVETDDPALAAQVARAALLVADLHESLGEYAKARSAYEKAADLYAALPDSSTARFGRAAADNNLAILLQSTGDSQDRERAEQLYQRAIELKRELVSEFPNDRGYRRSLAQSYNNLATFWQLARDRNRADDYFRKALAEVEQLRGEAGRPEDRRELALALVNYGAFLQSVGDAAAAADAYARAEAEQRELVAKFPTPVHRKELARTLLNAGALEQQADDKSTKALAKYDAAVDILNSLSREFPLVADYRIELAVALRNRALLYRQRGGGTAILRAADDYRRAADQLAPLATAAGSASATPRMEYLRILGERAQLTAAIGTRDAAQEAEEIWDQAIELAAGFAQSYPQETGFAREHARLLGNLGLYLAAQGRMRSAEAESRLRQAVELFERCEKVADDLEWSDRCLADRAYFAAALAGVLATRGEATAAAETWNRVFTLLDGLLKRPGYTYAARVIGQFATLAGKDWPHTTTAVETAARYSGRAAADTTLSEPQRQQLADAYAGVALELLRRLKEAGKLNREWLRSAEELAPLRSRADFRSEFGSPPPSGTRR
jgi:serine/threonine-protein kinase